MGADTVRRAAPPARRRRKLGLAAAVALVGGAAILFVMEVILRSSGVEPHGYVIVDEDTCFLAWGAGTHDETMKQGSRLVHRMWTDENGFRTADGEVKPGAKCRVLAVGDSFTNGQFVEADEAFPAVIEQLSVRRGARVEVDNGGMPGHTIAEERVAVLGRWGHLHPTVVLVSHTSNDLEDLIMLQRRGCRIDGPVPTVFQPAITDSLRDLRVVRATQEVAARIKMISPHMRSARQRTKALSLPASAEECAFAERMYLDLALDLTAVLAQKGSKVLFAMLEGFSCAGTEREAFQAEFTRRVSGAGARVVDVARALYEPGSSLRPEDSHPSPLGHRLLAEKIEADLFESGWLADCQ